MTTYTIAYNARCGAGWADSRGNLSDMIVETFDDKADADRYAAELNGTVGYAEFSGAYLTFYVEEMEDSEG